MESSTFRKWLIERGCRIEGDEHPKGHKGPVIVTVLREGRNARLALRGPRQALDRRDVNRVCQELELDLSQLPGPKSRV